MSHTRIDFEAGPQQTLVVPEVRFSPRPPRYVLRGPLFCSRQVPDQLSIFESNGKGKGKRSSKTSKGKARCRLGVNAMKITINQCV